MERIELIEKEWNDKMRWDGIQRNYTAEAVDKLRGSLDIEYSLARHGAVKLWNDLQSENFIRTGGMTTGLHAKQAVQAGFKAIYVSGWQTAADANQGLMTHPDLSLYPSNSVPKLVERINNALASADQIQSVEGKGDIDWYVPIVADAEAGFGGGLNAYELMQGMIRAGAAGVHFEDQLSSAKKCGHMGGKVVIPTQEFISKLNYARLAADVMGVPTVLIARTDAYSAKLITSEIDERDHQFIDLKAERTKEGFYRLKEGEGLELAIAKGLAYAPYSDMLWCETSNPDLDDARKFAEAIKKEYPDKMLAYNCSPSFHWRNFLDDTTISKFQNELAAMGYKFQFVTLFDFHASNHAVFERAADYNKRGMSAYAELQDAEFASQKQGYTAVKHQREVGAGVTDFIQQTASGGTSSTNALEDSTEKEQF